MICCEHTETERSGMKVEASALYNASFYYRFLQASNFSGGLSLALQSSSDSEDMAVGGNAYETVREAILL